MNAVELLAQVALTFMANSRMATQPITAVRRALKRPEVREAFEHAADNREQRLLVTAAAEAEERGPPILAMRPLSLPRGNQGQEPILSPPGGEAPKHDLACNSQVPIFPKAARAEAAGNPYPREGRHAAPETTVPEKPTPTSPAPADEPLPPTLAATEVAIRSLPPAPPPRQGSL